MTYAVSLTKRAEKYLDSLEAKFAEQVAAAIDRLASEPRNTSSKKLTDRGNQYSMRTGNYRLVYEIDDAARVGSGSTAELDRWVERLLAAKSIENVFDGD